ncbi:MAG: 2'-5' RNA ligase family protein [Candidatus Lokiarchaeota archaeon]|nr:2'-5' RNA ligase family protein [Candidatus Lokiarchaeota archaeon]
MKKVNTSAVVIIPPKEISSPIQEIRIKYDRQFNKWMPHITLLYPFRPEDEYNIIMEDYVKICKKIPSFRITLKKFKYFEHRKQNYTIWIEPEPSELIKNLQNSLLKLDPDCNDVNLYKLGFIPHLSVGQIFGKTQLLSLIEELNQKWVELSFLLEQITFIARETHKNSKFEVKKYIYLGEAI